MTATIERTDARPDRRARAHAARRRQGLRRTAPDAVTALRDIDLQVQPGEFVCLLGASGCGKSTLLNLVADLDAPSRGEVQVGTARPSFMFQEAALLPWLTARRNVELALQLAGQGRRERRTRADELLELVRLGGQGDKRPHELSGGMRQRVSLARALAATTAVGEAEGRPGMLLMDEPFAALDAITRDVLQAELLRVWEATGTAILFVTHDVREAIRLAAAGGAAVVAAGHRRPGVAGRRRPDGAARRRSPDGSGRSSPAMPPEPTPLHPGRSTDDDLLNTPAATAVLEDAAAAVAGLDALDTPTTTTRRGGGGRWPTGLPPLVALVAVPRGVAARLGLRDHRTSTSCRPRPTCGTRSRRPSTTGASGRSSGPRSAARSSGSPWRS